VHIPKVVKHRGDYFPFLRDGCLWLKIKRSQLPNKKTATKRHVKKFHMRSSATVFQQLTA
jgi:hypothetical protein